MKKNTLEYIQKVEDEIKKKYGYEAVKHPQADWNEQKEEEYQKQRKRAARKEIERRENHDKVDVGGFLMSKKLVNRDDKRQCPICHVYSFESRDDVFFNKFESCYKCYVQWIEDREERWLTGWRPTFKSDQK
jgi:hypothetical protein